MLQLNVERALGLGFEVQRKEARRFEGDARDHAESSLSCWMRIQSRLART